MRAPHAIINNLSLFGQSTEAKMEPPTDTMRKQLIIMLDTQIWRDFELVDNE